MIDETLAKHMVELLNDILALDPMAVTSLVTSGFGCNEHLAKHSTMQVRTCGCGSGLVKDDRNQVIYSLGVMGLLNGICGADNNGLGSVAAVKDKDTGQVKRFVFIDKESR